jgi:hypothetical protein
VRPDSEPAPPKSSWWRRTYRRFQRFMFEKQPGYEPPYHASGQGATISDPRYPTIFMDARDELPSTRVDRVAPDDGDEPD